MSTTGTTAQPPKKKAKTIRQRCDEDMAELEQRITNTFTSKLDRLEQALLAVAAPSHSDPSQPGNSATDHSCPPHPDGGDRLQGLYPIEIFNKKTTHGPAHG